MSTNYFLRRQIQNGGLSRVAEGCCRLPKWNVNSSVTLPTISRNEMLPTWNADVYLLVRKKVGGVSFVTIRFKTGPIEDPDFLEPRSSAFWINSRSEVGIQHSAIIHSCKSPGTNHIYNEHFISESKCSLLNKQSLIVEENTY